MWLSEVPSYRLCILQYKRLFVLNIHSRFSKTNKSVKFELID